jgi:hypothetical protein
MALPLVLTALQLLSLTLQLHSYQLIHGQVPASAPNTPIPQPHLLALDAASPSHLAGFRFSRLLLLLLIRRMFLSILGQVLVLELNMLIPQLHRRFMAMALPSVPTVPQ